MESKYKEKDIRGGKINRKIFVVNFTIMALAMLVRRKFVMQKQENQKTLPPWRGPFSRIIKRDVRNEIVVIGNDNPLHNERIAMTPIAGVIVSDKSETPSAITKLSFDLR